MTLFLLRKIRRAIVLGRGVLNGNFKAVVIGIGVIIAAMAAVHFIRQRYLKQREG